MENQISTNSLCQNLHRHKWLYILLILLILFNLSIFVGLFGDWIHDGNYSHGILVIPISIYLIYRHKGDLTFPVIPSKMGIWLLIMGCIGLIFGTAASELFALRVSLVLAITGLSLYYLGNQNFKEVWFAFFFLLFMIPIPAIIYYGATLPMQLFATRATNAILHIIGVPSNRAGNIILLPAYKLEVTEACSGLRSLASLLALAAIFGNLTLPGKIRPIVLFLAAIPIAIIVNIFRLVLTGIGAYAISPKLAESFLHEVSGIMIFILALGIMAILASFMRWKRKAL